MSAANWRDHLDDSNGRISKRFEEAVGLACEMASARQVARQFGLAASTVRAIDLRYLERWKREVELLN